VYKVKTTIKKSDLLSTGSTLLNIACTGDPLGGFWKGGYFYIVGDSQAGKTFVARTCLAEAVINKNFDNYRIIDDDVENGALMDTAKYFGQDLADRIEPPSVDEDGNPIYSNTIEDFYFNLDDAFNDDRPCIYLLDSQDALSSTYEQKRFQKRKKDIRGGREATGDVTDGKPKINSAGLRMAEANLRDTGSILIITGHTKDNVGATQFQPQKRTTGGRSLRYYAKMEIWLSIGKAIKVKVKGKDRKIGIISKVRVVKNRAVGRDRIIEFPIYYSLGIDDIGSCVDYLSSEGRWKKNKSGIINALDFEFEGGRESLIEHIESSNFEFDLKDIVADVWNDIEAACEVKRKPRF